MPTSDEPPLYVDLDGTLIATDLLHESFLSALARSPWVAVQSLGWLMSGRPRLKEELALRSEIDVTALPYREPVLAFLREERARGRRIVLATASWGALADRVAAHLGLFDEVLATGRDANLKGEAKASRLEAHCGGAGFDYVGDSRADFPVWLRSRYAYVVDSGGSIRGSMPPGVEVRRVFGPAARPGGHPVARALRPHQWAKNLLVFVPLAAAHRLGQGEMVLAAAQAFLCFCLLASSAYLLNDLLDLEADRAHPRKRARPLASGELSIPAGFALFALTLAGGFAASVGLPPAFRAALAAYFTLTLAYSFGLKRVAIVDVIALAGLYTVRIVAGAYAIVVPLSFWLLAFAMFLFFSLALVKRYAELVSLRLEGMPAVPGRGYSGHDVDIVLAMGAASAMVSALVLALYMNGDTVQVLYTRPDILWLLCPLLLYWVSRVWLLAARGQMHDDPVLFAVRDRASYAVVAAGAAIVWLAT